MLYGHAFIVFNWIGDKLGKAGHGQKSKHPQENTPVLPSPSTSPSPSCAHPSVRAHDVMAIAAKALAHAIATQ